MCQNVYILSICIIAGALSMSSTQVYQEILPNTLPREQEVYHVLDYMIFENHVIQYHPCCQHMGSCQKPGFL